MEHMCRKNNHGKSWCFLANPWWGDISSLKTVYCASTSTRRYEMESHCLPHSIRHPITATTSYARSVVGRSRCSKPTTAMEPGGLSGWNITHSGPRKKLLKKAPRSWVPVSPCPQTSGFFWWGEISLLMCFFPVCSVPSLHPSVQQLSPFLASSPDGSRCKIFAPKCA